MIVSNLEGNDYLQSIKLMPVSMRSKRPKPEVNRKEEMADQSVFKNLFDESSGPITQELKVTY